MLPAFGFGSAIDWAPTFPGGWGVTNTRGVLGVLRCFRMCYEVSNSQKLLRGKANTHLLGCIEIRVLFATYSAMDVSLGFDHGKSVAGAWRSSGR